MVLAYLNNLPYPIGEIILSVAALLVFWIAYKVGRIRAALQTGKQKKYMEKEHLSIQSDLKETWEIKKQTLEKSNASLKEQVSILESKLEDYRKKVAGLGVLSIGGNKKRNDILYSLLLENEMLEQLLFQAEQDQSEMKRKHLQDKFRDIQKRQRYLAEIFNDETIKEHIQTLLDQDKTLKVDTAKTRTSIAENPAPDNRDGGQ